MDLTESIKPKSDQLNSDELIAGPVTVTIEDVTQGSSEQPVNVKLREYPGRPYKPSKSMRRILVEAWGKDSSVYAGRRLTLFRNPKIRFGGEEIGGIQISHLSHIDKPLKTALTVSKGKRSMYTVQPLIEAQAAPAPPSPQQQMFNLLAQKGMTEKDSILAYVTDTLGRPIESSKELTDDDVTTILNRLTTQES